MPKIARLGDPGSHGGAIVTSAEKSKAEDILIARIGDIYQCPIHGPNPIVTGAVKTPVENQLCAIHGSKTACGASIIATVEKTYVE